MVETVFKISPDQLASAFGTIAFEVQRAEVVLVAGVDAQRARAFDRRMLAPITYSYELVTDYGQRNYRIGLINQTVSIGRRLDHGWEAAVTANPTQAARLKRLLTLIEVQADHRSAMTLLNEKKLQLAVAVVNTTHCLWLDDPVRELNYWERIDYWQAVGRLVTESTIGLIIRTDDLDLITNWSSRLLLIKGEQIVLDAPMLRVRRILEQELLIRISRQSLSPAIERQLFAEYPQCELNGTSLEIQVHQRKNPALALNHLQLLPADYTIETGRLSHFVNQGLLKSDFQLYWLNRRLNYRKPLSHQ